MSRAQRARFVLGVIGLAWCTVLAGCTFSRTVTNEHYRHANFSQIESGKTTWQEVLRTFGPPLDSQRPMDSITAKISSRFLKYASWDLKNFHFGSKYLFPFDWSDGRPVREILVEFNEDGTVKEVWETRNETVWRPFASSPHDPRTRRLVPPEAP